MNVMMDLVINHTATDAVITKTHPEWYMRNHDGSIKFYLPLGKRE